jgi:Tol biopolymer transport system component
MTWAPDGSRLAFVGVREHEVDTPGIYTVRPDGTGIEQLASDVSVVALAWSPDGQSIAFAGEHVGTVPAGGGPVTVLARGAGAESVAWSPSGARIAYSSSGFMSVPGAFTMARDGSDRGRIDDGSLGSVWSVRYRPVRSA